MACALYRLVCFLRLGTRSAQGLSKHLFYRRALGILRLCCTRALYNLLMLLLSSLCNTCRTALQISRCVYIHMHVFAFANPMHVRQVKLSFSCSDLKLYLCKVSVWRSGIGDMNCGLLRLLFPESKRWCKCKWSLPVLKKEGLMFFGENMSFSNSFQVDKGGDGGKIMKTLRPQKDWPWCFTT